MPQAVPVTLQETDDTIPDTYVNSGSTGTNYGTGTLMRVGHGTFSPTATRSLLHFDLATIDIRAGATVIKADLKLLVSTLAANAEAAYIRRLTQTGWVEDQATWNNYATPSLWVTAGGDYTTTGQISFNLPTSGSTQTIDIAGLAQDALDSRSGQLHIIMMRATESSPDATVDYYTGEHSVRRPSLIITFDYPQFRSPTFSAFLTA